MLKQRLGAVLMEFWTMFFSTSLICVQRDMAVIFLYNLVNNNYM